MIDDAFYFADPKWRSRGTKTVVDVSSYSFGPKTERVIHHSHMMDQYIYSQISQKILGW